MITLAAVVVGAVALLISFKSMGAFKTLLLLSLLSMAVLPRVLFGASEDDTYRVSISGENIRVFTYTVAILLTILVAVLLPRPGTKFLSTLPFLTLALVWSLTVWDGESNTWAGVGHLTVAVLAWIAGSYLRSSVVSLESPEARFLGWLLFFIVLFEAAVCVLQVMGVPVFPGSSAAIVQDASLAGRANGTFSHPSTVGKVMLLLLILVLPLTASSVRGIRHCAWWTLGFMTVPFIFSSGRVNFAGAIVAVLLWVATSPRSRSLGWRLMVPLFAGAVLVASWSVWSDRIETGENGLLRQHFSDVAIQQLGSLWATGVGPGNYVESLSSTDPWIAAGWPVHNTFLLAAAELSVVVAVALFLPIAVTVVDSVRNWRAPTARGGFARAFLVVLPGVLLVAWTGWGMLADALVVWMFVAGWVVGGAAGRSGDVSPMRDAQPVSRGEVRL